MRPEREAFRNEHRKIEQLLGRKSGL